MRSITDVCFDNMFNARETEIFRGVAICFDLTLPVNNLTGPCLKQRKEAREMRT